EPAEADAAALFGDVDRSKAQLRRGADRLAREDVLLVPFGRVRGDRIGGEFPRHLLDGKLVVGEFELGHFLLPPAAGHLDRMDLPKRRRLAISDLSWTTTLAGQLRPVLVTTPPGCGAFPS